MEGLIKLDLLDLVLALGMMGLAIGLSAWQQLGMEWTLAIATGRTLLQLLVVGYILAFIFALDNPWAVLAILLVMVSMRPLSPVTGLVKKFRAFYLWYGDQFLSAQL